MWQEISKDSVGYEPAGNLTPAALRVRCERNSTAHLRDRVLGAVTEPHR